MGGAIKIGEIICSALVFWAKDRNLIKKEWFLFEI
jgi:hypothetical protein